MEFDPKLLSIPFISGFIGYVTNFFGIKMLFYPVGFIGFRVPGLSSLARLLPRKLQTIPGLMDGKVGWQGVIPSRARKMGSLAVDHGIAKLGTPAEFYETLDPKAIAEHILESTRDDMRELVERIIEREHPRLWMDTPQVVRDAIHERVQAQLPAIIDTVTAELGSNIDHILDVKLMVMRHLEADPNMANQIFLDVGEKELNFVIKAGLYYGFLLGIPSIFIVQVIPEWWVLPIMGVLVGYLTNFIAIKQIFLPVEPTRIGPFTFQGLFMKRQHEASEAYAKLIASDVVNLENISHEFMEGRRADRTRTMVTNALRPAIDNAVGPLAPALRLVVGARQYDAIRESVASEAMSFTVEPMQDEAFNQRQSAAMRELLATRMQALPPTEFAPLLRGATEEDEWLLMFIGGLLGFFAGTLQSLFTLG